LRAVLLTLGFVAIGKYCPGNSRAFGFIHGVPRCHWLRSKRVSCEGGTPLAVTPNMPLSREEKHGSRVQHKWISTPPLAFLTVHIVVMWTHTRSTSFSVVFL